MFNVLPKELEEQIEIVGSGDRLFNCIKDLYCTYLERKDAVDNGQIPENYCSIYVLIHSMQYISDLFDENKNLDDSEFIHLMKNLQISHQLHLMKQSRHFLRKDLSTAFTL